MAANEGVVKAIVSFNRDDSDTVYLGLSYDLRPNILMPYFFFLSSRCVPPFSRGMIFPHDSVLLALLSLRKHGDYS